MIELKVAGDHLNELGIRLHRAYFDAVYRVTRAILEPVVAATSEAIQESFTSALREGIKEALDPAELVGYFLGRKKR